MSFTFSNIAITNVTNNFYCHIEEVVNFEKNISNFIDFLETLPSEIQTPGMSRDKWERLLFEDFDKAYEQLKLETNYQIKFVWILASFKIRELLNNILTLLDKGNYYSAMSLIRTLLEVVSFSNFYLNEMKPFIDKMNNNVNDFYAYTQAHKELEPYFQAAIKGTQIEAILQQNKDTVKAKSILNALDSLSTQDKYKNLRKYYDNLCESVHPNIMSNELFGVITNIYVDKNINYNEKERIGFIPGEIDLYLNHKSNKQQTMMLPLFYGFIVKVMVICFDIFKDTILEFKDVRVLKLNKPEFFKSLDNLTNDQKNLLFNEYKKSDQNS